MNTCTIFSPHLFPPFLCTNDGSCIVTETSVLNQIFLTSETELLLPSSQSVHTPTEDVGQHAGVMVEVYEQGLTLQKRKQAREYALCLGLTIHKRRHRIVQALLSATHRLREDWPTSGFFYCIRKRANVEQWVHGSISCRERGREVSYHLERGTSQSHKSCTDLCSNF